MGLCICGAGVPAGGGGRKPALWKCFVHVMVSMEDDSIMTPTTH